MVVQGGCLCGAVRYRLRHPRAAYWCHCTMCRRASGSAALPWVSVARGDFELVQGVMTTYASSAGVSRDFCGRCGSPILFDMACEDAVDVTLGTLDQPDLLPPSHHIWCSTNLEMARTLGSGLPRHAGEAP
ncbi:GFA family protein [Xanthobacter pseudotagetidis]|uniref:GFA family protein n=1 Tax=Xanthobacter pseudotagetidis TaxID=3119911 RepID=UPI00372A24CA